MGNIESFLPYKKLQRTGRLLRGLKIKRSVANNSSRIVLYNNVHYASEHQIGGVSSSVTIKPPYVHNGAEGVIMGGRIEARPYMTPSKHILKAPARLVGNKMRSYGW